MLPTRLEGERHVRRRRGRANALGQLVAGGLEPGIDAGLASS